LYCSVLNLLCRRGEEGEEGEQPLPKLSPLAVSIMSNLGDPARLRSGASEGMQHHLAVSPSAATQGDFGNALYAPHHQLPNHLHHHNSQFLFGNGDLAALQSAQYPATDLFDHCDHHWQPQHQQHQPLQQHQQQQQHQNQSLPHLQHHPQNFQPQQQQFNQTAPTLPEHHTYQQFGSQLAWQSSVSGPSDSVAAVAFPQQHGSINLPTRIASSVVNGTPAPSDDRTVAQSNTFSHTKQQQPQSQQNGQMADCSNSPQPRTIAAVAATVTMLGGTPHVSVHGRNEFPDTFGEFPLAVEAFHTLPFHALPLSSPVMATVTDSSPAAIEAMGYLGEPVAPAPTTTLVNKKPRLSAPVSAPSPATTASPAPAPATPVHAVNAVTTKATPKPAAPVPAPKSKVPTEPLARMKYLLTECLEDEEEEARDLSLRAWGIVSDVSPEQTEMVTNAVNIILKTADDQTLVCMGKILQFTMKLRKWIVHEHNKEKKSPLIPKMLKVSLSISDIDRLPQLSCLPNRATSY